MRKILLGAWLLAACVQQPPPSAAAPAAAAPAPAPAPAANAKASDGASCLVASDCQSGVCEGLGCGPDTPGHCAARARPCTQDYREYCGCNGKTFHGSGSCPGQRFAARAACPDPGAAH